jgi:hypothetical protein
MMTKNQSNELFSFLDIGFRARRARILSTTQSMHERHVKRRDGRRHAEAIWE